MVNRVANRIAIALAIGAWAWTAAAQEESAEEEYGDGDESQESLPLRERLDEVFSGSVHLGFDFVNADGVSDINLNQSLRLTARPPKHENVKFYTSLWMHEDLDSDEESNSVLRDINDTYDSDVRARLLELYMQVDELWGRSTLRVGRQRVIEGVAFNRIDGAYFKKYYRKVDWYLFAGVQASIYEDRSDDLTYGGGASFQLTPKTRLAIDGYYGEETRRRGETVFRGTLLARVLGFRFPRRVRRTVDDSLVALSLWQTLADNHQLFTKLTIHEGEAEELLIDFTGYFEKLKLTYEAAYRRLLEEQGDRVNDATAFFRILGVQEEYDHYLLTLSRPLTEKLTLSVEGELRDTRNDDPRTANRDFHRYGAVLDAKELLWDVDTSLAVDRWDVEGGESLWSVTGELEKTFGEVDVTLGVDYERFEDQFIVYDPRPLAIRTFLTAIIPGLFPGFAPLVLYFDEPTVKVREDIYSAYSKVKWRISDNQDLSFRLRYEEDEGRESPYWRFRVNYAFRF